MGSTTVVSLSVSERSKNQPIPQSYSTDETCNYPVGMSPEIETDIIREMARSVLGRAFADLRGTKDYAIYKKNMNPGCYNSIDSMIVGEEVREWFSDDESLELFSFRFCCEMGGYCIRRIKQIIEPYMNPKNRELISWMDGEHDILRMLREKPGLAHTTFMSELNKKYNPTAVRLLIKSMRKDNLIYTHRTKLTGTRKDITRWYLRENPHEKRPTRVKRSEGAV